MYPKRLFILISLSKAPSYYNKTAKVTLKEDCYSMFSSARIVFIYYFDQIAHYGRNLGYSILRFITPKLTSSIPGRNVIICLKSIQRSSMGKT